ncbi:MAG: AAA family ATPase [Acidimicrobiales bacterium]
MRILVVVSGAPASGKSALARPLAERLAFPLVAKDTIKEAMFDTLGGGDAAWSARLSDAAYEVMFALLPWLPQSQAVIEANFRPEHVPRLLALGPRPLEVHCVCPQAERERRWAGRRRHPGHLDADHPMIPAPAASGPLRLGPDVLEVDTTGVVDAGAVAAWVRDRAPGQGEDVVRA